MATSVGTQNQTYNTIYVGAGWRDPSDEARILTLNYTANIQTSNSTICTGASCAARLHDKRDYPKFEWRARPFVLQ